MYVPSLYALRCYLSDFASDDLHRVITLTSSSNPMIRVLVNVSYDFFIQNHLSTPSMKFQ